MRFSGSESGNRSAGRSYALYWLSSQRQAQREDGSRRCRAQLDLSAMAVRDRARGGKSDPASLLIEPRCLEELEDPIGLLGCHAGAAVTHQRDRLVCLLYTSDAADDLLCVDL